MKARNLYRIVTGVILILSALISFLTMGSEVVIGTIMLASGMAFLVTGLSRHRKFGDDLESDERSKKIGAYGLSYSWLAGLFFMTGLFWLDYFGILRLSAQMALSVSIVMLAISAVIIQMYLFRKGDVG